LEPLPREGRRRSLVFSGPGRVEVVEEPWPDLAPRQVMVQTRVSAVSAGTELLAYRGELPAHLQLDETISSLADRFEYPFRYGYAAVGDVVAVGKDVDGGWLGKQVFGFEPHSSHFVAEEAALFPVSEGVQADAAVLLPAMETAVNLLLDGQPRIGEKVVVLGQGVVGLMTTALLARFPLDRLVTVEDRPIRGKMSHRMGAHQVLTTGQAALSLVPRPFARGNDDGADLTYELSGNPAALDLALTATGAEGRIVVGSWYGSKKAALDLGGHFHRGRLTLLSSQVSHIRPALTSRWNKRRGMGVAWRLLGEIDTAALVTHRFDIAEAQQAYELLDRHPDEALQVLFSYGK